MKANILISAIISIGIAMLILWQMLLPGYILTLDLVFTPHFFLTHTPGDFWNSYPLWFILHALSLVIPGWIVEKMMLVVMFFLISFLSFNFLPVPKRFSVRLFASLLYTANTFVYVRMLAGQWTHLYAYALLPLFIHLLLESTKKASYKTELALGAVMALIGMFSLQIFLMSMLMAIGWWIWNICHKWAHVFKGDWKDGKSRIADGGLAFLTLLILTSYWTIPALLQHGSIVSQFTSAHWQEFAASSHGTLPLLLNLLMLGGFWAERFPWATYFVWPQFQPIFQVAFAGVLVLAVLGIVKMYKNAEKDKAIFLIVTGILAFIFATGAAVSPFQGINIFLYQHIPFWDGFRDSQKFIAVLALCYAIFAAYGFSAVLEYMEQHRPKLALYGVAILFLIPLAFGMFMWGGFAKQLTPVQYPEGWNRVAAELKAHPEAKALILPWQGYFSLSFDRNLIVANPAQQYFGSQAVVSQNFRLGSVYDQSSDPAYQDLDNAIQYNFAPQNTPDGSRAEYLRSLGIEYVAYFQDLKGKDNFTYEFLQSPGFTLEWADSEVEFYKIDPAI